MNISKGRVVSEYDRKMGDVDVTYAHFEGVEGPIQWILIWNDDNPEASNRWTLRLRIFEAPPPNDTWRGISDHSRFPIRGRAYGQAVKVAQILARRFNWARDGRGQHSDLAKWAETVKLV